MTSLMQHFRHFWLNVQSIALAGLTPKHIIVFVSLKQIEWYPILPKKTNFKIYPPAHFRVTGQIRSKLVILGIIRFGATRSTLWYSFHSSIIFGSKAMGNWVTSSLGYKYKYNAKKTQLIVLGTRQQIRQIVPIEIRFMGTTIVGTSSAKNLGVTTDESTTFFNHVSNVVRRCTGILSGLSHSRHYLPKSTLARV